MAKDFLGEEINVGDEVVFVQMQYRNFYQGKIVKITDKMLFIDHEKDNLGKSQTKQKHNQVIKI